MQLTESGILYYWSGLMKDDYSMRGTIEVLEQGNEDECKPLSVKIGEVEADQDITSGNLSFQLLYDFQGNSTLTDFVYNM